MSVRYTARALGQLAEIFDYIAQHNPRAAHAVQLRIKLSIERLDDFPFAGRITDHPGVRVLTIVRYPYRVFYRTSDAGDVLVLRIMHAARDPSRAG
jgi:addiction module RelE/StbE family toxin